MIDNNVTAFKNERGRWLFDPFQNGCGIASIPKSLPKKLLVETRIFSLPNIHNL